VSNHLKLLKVAIIELAQKCLFLKVCQLVNFSSKVKLNDLFLNFFLGLPNIETFNEKIVSFYKKFPSRKFVFHSGEVGGLVIMHKKI
jgi:hypothetical protein